MKPVLVDTSVWRRYFAGAPAVRALGDLLDEDGMVLVHPFVVGEMVLGGLSAREEALFGRLPAAAVVPHDEVLSFVRRRKLARRGIGWVDARLLRGAPSPRAERCGRSTGTSPPRPRTSASATTDRDRERREAPQPHGHSGCRHVVLASPTLQRRLLVRLTPSARRRAVASILAGLFALATRAAAQDSQYWNIQYGPVGQLLGRPGGRQHPRPLRDLLQPRRPRPRPRTRTSCSRCRRSRGRTLTSRRRSNGGAFLDNSRHGVGDVSRASSPSPFPKSWLGDKTRLAFSVLTRQEFVQRTKPAVRGDELGERGTLWPRDTVRPAHARDVGRADAQPPDRRPLRPRRHALRGLPGPAHPLRAEPPARVPRRPRRRRARGQRLRLQPLEDARRRSASPGKATRFRLGGAVTTPGAGLFGSGNAGFTRSATGLDLNGDGKPDSLLVNGLDDKLDASYHSSWAFAGGGAWRRGSMQLARLGRVLRGGGAISRFWRGGLGAGGPPLALVQELAGRLNVGVGVEYWLGGVERGPGTSTTARRCSTARSPRTSRPRPTST